MSRYNKYEVVVRDEEEFHELVETINEMVSLGYEPLGGVSIRVGSQRGARYVQSLFFRGADTELRELNEGE